MTEKLATEMNDTELQALLDERKAKRKAEVEKTKPTVVEVLLKEGGTWIVWAPNALRIDPEQEKKGNYHNVHAIKFEDGSIWDVAYGWRG
jgi:hypothetical protein